MIYVMSDIHGEYQKYLNMLELIQFSDKDSLFILGDVVDRGPEPVSVLKDMMLRPNVFPIMGNHDFLAYYLLSKLGSSITGETIENTLEVDEVQDILEWIDDGGASTVAQFQKLTPEERQDILDYIAEFPFYETSDVGENTFILVHAGLGNFRPDKKLSEYSAADLITTREDPDRRFFDNEHIYIITGHTPTPLISGKPEIYHSANNIYIDCGACFETGRLACLCLDTMQEFYI